MSDIRKMDECAASLMALYAKEGNEFAIVLRTCGTKFRLIGPQTDVTQLSEWLHLIADTLFKGEGVVASKPN